jgi:large subunit ribosomal protein L13
VVINAEKIGLTGRKITDKIYYHHSGYPGGIKAWPAHKLLVKKPEELIRRAVQGMLPKNPLGRQMLRKLKIYAGGKHPHDAQKPHLLEL